MLKISPSLCIKWKKSFCGGNWTTPSALFENSTLRDIKTVGVNSYNRTLGVWIGWKYYILFTDVLTGKTKARSFNSISEVSYNENIQHEIEYEGRASWTLINKGLN
jgi:hypothetical protein